MPRLLDAVQALGLDGEVSFSGRWVKLQGDRCLVYVVEAAGERGYYTWCDAPDERAVERYIDPFEAVRAGLRRATCAGRDRTYGSEAG